MAASPAAKSVTNPARPPRPAHSTKTTSRTRTGVTKTNSRDDEPRTPLFARGVRLRLRGPPEGRVRFPLFRGDMLVAKRPAGILLVLG